MKIVNILRLIFISIAVMALHIEGIPTLSKKASLEKRAIQKDGLDCAEKRVKELAQAAAVRPKKRDMHTSIFSLLYAGYNFTEDEKNLAYEIIADLQERKVEMTCSYKEIIGHRNCSKQEKNAYRKSYQKAVQKIDKKIQQQKIITGDVWSNTRTTFWTLATLVGAAGAVGLGVSFGTLVSKYLSAPVDILKPTDSTSKSTESLQSIDNQEIINIPKITGSPKPADNTLKQAESTLQIDTPKHVDNISETIDISETTNTPEITDTLKLKKVDEKEPEITEIEQQTEQHVEQKHDEQKEEDQQQEQQKEQQQSVQEQQSIGDWFWGLLDSSGEEKLNQSIQQQEELAVKESDKGQQDIIVVEKPVVVEDQVK